MPSPENARRIAWLHAHDEDDLPNPLGPPCHQGSHTYKSMYGRLRWDRPAQTITSGYGSMGQGRYVHPRQWRTLTPHEAARLQMIPDFFEHATIPKANADYWLPKLKANVARDRRNDRELEDAGWSVLRLWEHQPVDEMADHVEAVVRDLRRCFDPT